MIGYILRVCYAPECGTIALNASTEIITMDVSEGKVGRFTTCLLPFEKISTAGTKIYCLETHPSGSICYGLEEVELSRALPSLPDHCVIILKSMQREIPS